MLAWILSNLPCAQMDINRHRNQGVPPRSMNLKEQGIDTPEAGPQNRPEIIQIVYSGDVHGAYLQFSAFNQVILNRLLFLLIFRIRILLLFQSINPHLFSLCSCFSLRPSRERGEARELNCTASLLPKRQTDRDMVGGCDCVWADWRVCLRACV